MKMLPGSVGKMFVKGHGTLNLHVNEVIKELEDYDLRNRIIRMGNSA